MFRTDGVRYDSTFESRHHGHRSKCAWAGFSMSFPPFLVDACADAPFGGNSAAVCLLAGPVETAWMQALAAEFREPATAFVWPAGDGFGLRWFVAETELRLCGHGTLAAAHVLWEDRRLPLDAPARFFAPSVGLNEDAVTGSAHCAIGPFWGQRLGRATLRAYQASGRGGGAPRTVG